VQLAIFWVATSFVAAGIFLVPMISGREPRGQHALAYGLLGALAIVVFGSLIGEFAGIHHWLKTVGSWFGDQGFEYLDLGRFWQVLLTLGLFAWTAICSAAFEAGCAVRRSRTCRGCSSSPHSRSPRSTPWV
jgi:nitric oxide reductase subunit B